MLFESCSVSVVSVLCCLPYVSSPDLGFDDFFCHQ
jgi:hypothetical protein